MPFFSSGQDQVETRSTLVDQAINRDSLNIGKIILGPVNVYLDIFENRVCFTVLAFFWHINSIFGHKNAGSWKIFLVKNDRTTDSQSIIFVKDNRWNPSTTISYACPKLWNPGVTTRQWLAGVTVIPSLHGNHTQYICLATVLCVWMQYAQGELPCERGRDARRKFWIIPLKETNLGVVLTFFDPYKCFDYMNRVNKINWKYIIFYISSCATLKEIPFWPNIIINGVLPRTP